MTDHGRAVARLVGLTERPLDRLIAQGRVTPASKPRWRPAQRIIAHGTVSDLIAEQRR